MSDPTKDYSDTITFTVPLNYRETNLIIKALRHYIADNKGQFEETALAATLVLHMEEANERVMGKEYDPTGWKVVE